MPDRRHVVVDGSNLATEGRTVPSFAQLRDAVRTYRKDHPGVIMTVVVDASFGYLIDSSERAAFREAEASGEVVSPPAGAIGRGDGFLLKIADLVRATVVSNDSFREFHDRYPWLFDADRLVGGKPVPNVGWVFSERVPVRTRPRREPGPAPAPEGVVRTEQAVAAAIAEARAEAPPTTRRRRRRRHEPPQAVNEPTPYTAFLLNHRLGDEIEGRVERFTSHGAVVVAEGVRCYVPLAALGDPPPSRARAVLHRGERRRFVVQAFDAHRRGVELGLPRFAHLAGAPTPDTIEAELEDT
jgi:hypothetical protein